MNQPRKCSKPFVIQQQVNPNDDWKPFKRFSRKDIAVQSLETLKKNVCNVLKNSQYMQYRVFDKTTDTYTY